MIKLFIISSILILTAGCVRGLVASPPHFHDASLDELVARYQKQQEAVAPLVGLMEVTVRDKVKNRFFAKWSSDPSVIKIKGFDPIGGTLFDLSLSESDVFFESADSRNDFQGSRAKFSEYLSEQSSLGIRPEWLSLFDWIARGGLPNFATLPPVALEKDYTGFILYFFKQEATKNILTHKVWIDRATFRVQDVIFFDASGKQSASLLFGDYRFVNGILYPFYVKGYSDGKHHIEIVFKELKAVKK
ncbi:MAG: hypothetical protein AAB317_03070 [Nitrospirota bacterium]